MTANGSVESVIIEWRYFTLDGRVGSVLVMSTTRVYFPPCVQCGDKRGITSTTGTPLREHLVIVTDCNWSSHITLIAILGAVG